MAHRLELAVKDALKATAFDSIDDLLLRLYYLYEKSLKKCKELEDIVTDLKECLSFDDAGIKPVRASGSRWVAHKLNAMKQIVSRFGAYTNHIAALSEDRSVKSADRAKLTRVKNCAQIPARARNITLLYNACTRDISPIILRTDT